MKELSWKEKRILPPIEYDEKYKIVFQHAVMCHVGLPRKFTNERAFERQSGRCSLRIEAGTFPEGGQWIEQPLPYGARPRLIMLYLSTQFKLKGSRIINTGKSLGDFLQKLKVAPTGDNYGMVKKQLKALAACHIKLAYPIKDGGDGMINCENPIRRLESSLVNKWSGELELSEEFARSLEEYGVPLSEEAISKVSDSALELDILCWLAHRLCRINKNSGIMISWENLKDQFGQEYGRMSNFKKQFIISLRYAISAYSDAKVSEEDNGIILFPSRPLVAKKLVQVLL